MRKRKMRRKENILKHSFCILTIKHVFDDERELGKLAKGKVHCSCPSCSPKTKRTWNGAHTNSLSTYKIQDRRNLERLMYVDDNVQDDIAS